MPVWAGGHFPLLSGISELEVNRTTEAVGRL